MDITGEREAENTPSEAPLPQDALEFTPEQVQTIEAADARITAAAEMLERLSTPEQAYGFPQEIEKVALMNAMFTLMVAKGVCTMQEVFIAKRHAIAEQAEGVVEMSKAHKREVEMAKIAVGADQMPKAPPPPPRKQRARRR